MDISYDNGFVIIKNKMKKNEDNTDGSHITVDALRYFFDLFYGKNQFFSGPEIQCSDNYITKIPCRGKKMEMRNNANNSCN